MTNPIIEYFPNGIKRFEKYYLNGHYHRNPLEGPARIEYYDNGNKKLEQYRLNGQYHRDPLEGPAYIFHDENANEKILEEYWFNGKFHNPYGPTVIFSLFGHHWFFNGFQYTNEVNEYLKINNLDYKTMTQLDFDIMWMNLL